MAYAEEHGHCNVPQRWDVNPSLGRFVKINRQYFVRKHKKQGKRSNPLNDERKALLDAIGFVWDIRKGEAYPYGWDFQFRKLKAFHRQYGHFNVPSEPKYRRLHGWVVSMRYFFKMKLENDTGLHLKILTPERELQLEMIGFFANEATHDAAGKSSSPPIKRKARPKEITPVVKKAKPTLKSKVKLEAVEELEAAAEEGLPQGVTVPAESKYPYARQQLWSKCFDMLTVYKGNTGHTQVPSKRLPHDDPIAVLYAFVTEMRKQKRKKNNGQPSLLSDEQEALLDSLGFEWATNFEVEAPDEDVSPDANREEEIDAEEIEGISDPEGDAWKANKPAAAAAAAAAPKEVIQPSLFELVNELDCKDLQEAEEESPNEMDYDSDGSGDSLVF
jgi:hypothetical protein